MSGRSLDDVIAKSTRLAWRDKLIPLKMLVCIVFSISVRDYVDDLVTDNLKKNKGKSSYESYL